MNRNINEKILTSAFLNYSETIWVYLKDSQTKGKNFDPFRNTGYTISNQNPLPVKALPSQLQSNSLIMREIGLSETGSINIIIKKKDLSLIKLATKIIYDGIEYSTFCKALGNKVQIFKRGFGFFRIILFTKGK